MGIEFELKYTATEAVQNAIRNDVTGNWYTIPMETTYYDTHSGNLSQRHYTLRRRLENGASICTIKIPAGEIARGEWETECSSIEKAILELCKLGAPDNLLPLTEEGLEAVCGARFTRQACITWFGETMVEIALDAGILFNGQREIPLCELEIEWKKGPQEGAVAFAKLLEKKYGLHTQPKSKFRRALDLRKGE